MPHKHRRRDDNDAHYNLPPTSVARSLPVGKNAATVFTSSGKKSKTEKASKAQQGGEKEYSFDDTPKAFARLLQRQKATGRLPSGLDNGERASKKRKREEKDDGKKKKSSVNPPPPPKSKIEPVADVPKIMPGEKLRDFNARVDQALPVSGLARKGKIAGIKERRTKTEKRMHKMYDDWRKEDERIKEKAEEEAEEREEEQEEQKAMYGEDTLMPVMGGGKRRRRMIGEQKADKEDPWAELNKKRNAPKGLHDVAQAPPEFTVKPKEKFKMKNNARVDVLDVPNAAGSLKRREELGAERKSIIEQYRALMGRGSG
ncbi:hypothetical protein AAFC00_000611 [Neodothiora populina]|uniref:Urease accessory protein UreD n=1 Tax=Neodothiora populina TaxID=2781224 RepID=A0ABR3PDG6_9PEZI